MSPQFATNVSLLLSATSSATGARSASQTLRFHIHTVDGTPLEQLVIGSSADASDRPPDDSRTRGFVTTFDHDASVMAWRSFKLPRNIGSNKGETLTRLHRKTHWSARLGQR